MCDVSAQEAFVDAITGKLPAPAVGGSGSAEASSIGRLHRKIAAISLPRPARQRTARSRLLAARPSRLSREVLTRRPSDQHRRSWPDSSVAGIHSGPKLSGDKLPSVAVEHYGRI